MMMNHFSNLKFNFFHGEQEIIELKVIAKSIQQTLTFQILNKKTFEDRCPNWKGQNPIEIEEITDLTGIYNFFNSMINDFNKHQFDLLNDTFAKLSLQSGYCSQLIPQLSEKNDARQLLKLYSYLYHSLTQKDLSSIENILSLHYSSLLDDPQSNLISIDVQYHHRILSNALRRNNFPYSKFAKFIINNVEKYHEIVFLLSQLCISNFDEKDVDSLEQIDNAFAYFNHSDLYSLYKENKQLQSENQRLKEEIKKLQNLNQQHVEILSILKNIDIAVKQNHTNLIKHASELDNQLKRDIASKFNTNYEKLKQIDKSNQTKAENILQEIQNMRQSNNANFDQRTNEIITHINQIYQATNVKENEILQILNQHNSSVSTTLQTIDATFRQNHNDFIELTSELDNQLKRDITSELNNNLRTLRENLENSNHTKSENIIQEIQNMRSNLKTDIQGSRDKILRHVNYVDKFPHQLPNQFKGILNKLKQINSIEIRHGAEVFKDYKATNLIEYSNNTYFCTLNNGDSDKNWLEFDFKTKRVVLSGYEIKAPKVTSFVEGSPDVEFMATPKSWKMLGSNDINKSSWVTLDTQENRSELNGVNNVGYFECQTLTHKGYRYIRFVQNDCWGSSSSDRYDINIAKFELYGKILE